MTKIILVSLLGLSFLGPALAKSPKPKNNPNEINIPIEVSTMLLSTDFADALQEARQHYSLIRMTKIVKADLQGQKFLTVLLESYQPANFAMAPAGSIVANYSFGPMGLVSIDGLFYKPAEEAPKF